MKRIVFGTFLLLLSFYSSAVDVQISQLTDTPDPVTRGADVTYAISLLNANNDTASNVRLAVPLPSTTSFVSVDDGNCSHDGGSPGTLNCNFGNITGNGAGGPITTVNLTVRTSANSGAIIALTATVSTDSIDTDPSNDNETQNTTIQNGADLNITQTDSADPVTTGGTYNYTLNVNNIGPNTATDVIVTNTLPANVTYLSYTGSGWGCSDAGQVITCTLTSLASGDAASAIALNVRVTGASAGTVTNSVTVGATTSDANVSNNTSTEDTIIIAGTDLSITKSVSTPVVANTATTFTLSPRNLGPNNATTVSVSDSLPTGFSYVSAVGTGWACSESSGTITCTRASYNVGASDDIVIQTTAPASSNNITNTATISSTTNEADNTNNSDSVTFSVLEDGADLSIIKTKTPDPVVLSGNMTSEIRVTNIGPKNTSGTVTVVDTLDANESYVSSSGTNWSCTHDGSLTGGDVTCSYLNTGVPIVLMLDETTSDLRIITKAENTGVLANTACATDNGGETDGVSGNNCATASVTATNNVADLEITQVVSTPGGLNKTLENSESTITYVLTVRNLGSDIIDIADGTVDEGVKITNSTPAYFSGVGGVGTTVVNVSITGGSQQNFNCTQSSNFIQCLLNDGETFVNGDTVEVTITTARGLIGGTYQNVAKVFTRVLADTNPSNDTSIERDIIIEGVADLELQSLTITPDPTKAGTDATYVISYRNNGPSTATNVEVVHDFFPPGGRDYELRSISASQGSCGALVGHKLTCSVGTLASGATETITLVVRPSWDGADNAWILGNIASISSADTPDNTATNDSKSTNLNVDRAELDLLVNNVDVTDPVGWTPTPGAFPTSLDNVIVYKIDVTNSGPSLATGVQFTDVMTPKTGKQTTFLCDSAGQTGCLTSSSICTNTGSIATGPTSITTICTMSDLAANDSATRYLYFYANSEPDATGDTHTNVTTVSSSNEEDTLLANNIESETTSVRVMVDVGVAITPSKTPVEINEPFTWNVVIDNNGPGSSADTALTNVLPAGMELTGTPIPAQGTCTGNVGDTSYTCSLGTVDNGDNTSVSVPVKITTYPTGGTTSNPVSVSTFGVDTDGSNDNAIGVVNVVRSSIAGVVFNDQNDNGVINSSEHGITTVTVTLTGTDNSGNSVNEVTTTNTDGEYLFENLSSGANYVLTETHPANFNDGLDNANGVIVTNSRVSDVISSVVLGINTTVANYNFGDLGQASVSGTVWYDENNNGTKDITELTGVPNVLITLTGVELVSGKNVTFTYTTGSDGTYLFNNITAGTYTITETQPTAWKDGGEELGNAGGNIANDTFSNIVLTATQTASGYNFGEEGGSISGKVYRDENDNGIAENTEAGITNVSIRLIGTDTDGKSVDFTTLTNSSGEYSFTGLPASNGAGYTITETQPTFVFDGKDTLGNLGGVLGNDQFTGISVTALSIGTGYNFGEGVDIDSSIAGVVFIDTNDNGLKDASELPLNNITLTLTGTDRLGATYNQAVVTNASGEYIFSNIVASDATGYTITETQPADYDDSVESIAGVVIAGTNTQDFISGIQLNDNQQLTNYNFAEVYAGSLSGTVFIDDDNNGVLNGTESGISGVNLQLSGTDTFGDPVSASTTSAVDGSYRFTQIIPSNTAGYQVIQTHPTGYVDSFDSIGNTVIANSNTTDAHTTIIVALQSNLTEYNFGELSSSSLAGVVFNDLNDDGIQDINETGLANIAINLTGIDSLGNGVALTVTTDVNGQYVFDNLLASNAQGYQITETQPSGYLDGLDSENSVVSANSRTTDSYTLVTTGGINYTGYNFGELTPTTITGTVFNDLDDDGIQDAGESGLTNITINLTGTDSIGNSVALTVTTDVNGQYMFENLRASNAQGYQVTETQPSDYLDGLDSENSVVLATSRTTDSYTLVTTNGINYTGYNFGEITPTAITGTVFNDLDDDGIQDVGESGLTNITINLTGTDSIGNSVSLNVTTDIDGNYVFENLRASNGQGYQVVETQPTGYVDGLDSENSVVSANSRTTDSYTLVTAGGINYSGYNFGELSSSSLIGVVFNDLNDDGIQDAGETGLANVTINLTGIDSLGSSIGLSVTTNTNGQYSFDNLLASNAQGYQVTETQPSGYLDGLDSENSVVSANSRTTDSYTLVTTGGNNYTGYNFGELTPTTITGIVFDDLSDDGIQDAGETGLTGVTVNLTGVDSLGNNITLTVTTDVNGQYVFENLRASNGQGYQVTETQPNGYLDGLDTENSVVSANSRTTDSYNVVAVIATDYNGYNFGELSSGSLVGTVFNDLNDDGIQDAGEAGLAGVIVNLTGTDSLGNGVALTVTTDVDGHYVFENLRSSNGQGYQVTETQPNGYLDGLDSENGVVSANSRITDSYTLVTVGGSNYTGYNFGELTPTTIIGTVFNDLNDDGIQDAGEAGLANVTINLTGTDSIGNSVALTVITDVNGQYVFENLRASNAQGYQAIETQPSAYLDGLDSENGVVSANSRTTDSYTLVAASGINYTGYNFGELNASSLAGFVFNDLNDDGIQDTGEAGLANVMINLTGTNSLGNSVSLTVTTDANGQYVFENLLASNAQGYQITEIQPNGYLDGLDSENGVVSANSRITDSYTLVTGGGTHYTGYNFGELVPASITGIVFDDLNDDGIQDVGETGLANVTVNLTGTDNLGNSIALALTTDANGQYVFENLRASNAQGYQVTETQPTGYLDGLDSENGVVSPNSRTTDSYTLVTGNAINYTGYNFGELAPTSITGFVFNDLNDNGVQDAGETGIANVTVNLTGISQLGDNVTLTIVTDANGQYTFENLLASNAQGYQVTETQPNGYVDGLDSENGVVLPNSRTTDSYNLVVSGGTDYQNYNFGELNVSTLTGFVFNDLNDDGIQAKNEPGIEGVELALVGTDFLGDSVSLIVLTDENGQYTFTRLLASNAQGYQVTETQPDSFLDGQDSENGVISQGSHYTDSYSLVVASSTDYAEYNFGELNAATLSGTVWVDKNNNGQLDESETERIANVTITLSGRESYERNNTVKSLKQSVSENAEGLQINQTAVTDENGNYQFTQLRAGVYSITQEHPAAWLDGKEQIGNLGGELESNDVISDITVNASLQAEQYNFGEGGSHLSGIVFSDLNDNGVQETVEAGIPDVIIEISGTDSDGRSVNRTTLTNVDGSYTFFDIPLPDSAGYTITEIQPVDVDDGKDNVGSHGGTLTNDVVQNIMFNEHTTLLTQYNFGEILTQPATVSGMVWLDSNHNRNLDEDTGLGGWTVELIDVRNNPLDHQNITPIATVITDNNGAYLFDGLSAGTYEIRFIHPDNNVVYGYPVSSREGVDLSNGTIRHLTIETGESVEDQNLPIDPSGVVYNTKTREPVAGARVTIEGPAGFDPDRDLVGGLNNITQTTSDNGIYQYLLFNTAPSGEYRLSVVEPTGYVEGVAPSIPACVNTPTITSIPATILVQEQDGPPPLSAEIHDENSCPTTSADFASSNNSTQYYLTFNIDPLLPSGNIINNHIPLEPYSDEMLSVTKTSQVKNASRGDIVPYIISVVNNKNYQIDNVNVIDQLPPGFKYIQGSARFDGIALEPTQSGRQIVWGDISFTGNQQSTIELMTRVGSGVSEGEYINQAWALHNPLNVMLSNIADATVRIVPDPIFDCSDIVGKVFNDENANGYQDNNEKGLPAIRLATARGLLVTTDSTGKYHITCAAIPNEHRGSNFILKVDERTLPSGFRITTENPRVVRLTRGKLVKANFGATIHRVVRIQLTDLAFEQNSLKPKYLAELYQAIVRLKEKPSIIRLAYGQGTESTALIEQRLDNVKAFIEQEWQQCDCNYELMVEEEVYQSNPMPDVLRKVGGSAHE